MLNPCLHFTTNKLTISKHTEKILEHPIFLNPQTKLTFSSNNPYFCSIPTNNITLLQLLLSMWLFLNFLPISDWLLCQPDLYMLLHWQQICAF